MRYLIIGVLLCAILAVSKMTNHLLSPQIINLNSNYMIDTVYDLSIYLLIPLLYSQFKNKVLLYVLLLCWISMDTVSYSSLFYGWKKHAWYAIFNLITLSYFAIQYKRNVNIIISFGIMVAFQIFMILDWFNGDSKTILYTNYHSILTGIHLLTISTLVRWDGLFRFRENIIY